MRIWYFPRLASGSCVGVALGLGRSYLIEVCAQCVCAIGQMHLLYLGSCRGGPAITPFTRWKLRFREMGSLEVTKLGVPANSS